MEYTFAAENDEESDSFDESFIQAEHIENHAKEGQDVSEQLNAFLSLHRLKYEDIAQEVYSRALECLKDLKEQQRLNLKVFQSNQEESFSGFECNLTKYYQAERQKVKENTEFKRKQEIERIEKSEEILDNAKKEFIVKQRELLEQMQVPKSLEEDIPVQYVVCQELECPVCLTEMLPPVRIWQCSSGHALCQSCKRNPNINRKCPTCRQPIVGRATVLEKMAATMFTKITGEEVPEPGNIEEEENNEDEVNEEEDDEISSSDILHMLYLPMRHSARPFRNPVESLDAEITRLINNISFIQSSRSSGEL